MFDFFKTECPVDDTDKKWIEDSLFWIYSPARKIKFKDFDFIDTTKYFPSDNLQLKEIHVYKIFEKIKRHMKMPEDLTCEVRLVEPDRIPLPEGLRIEPNNQDPLSFKGYMEDNKFIIDLNTKYLSAPFYIVSMIAYSLTFYKLIKEELLENVSGFTDELATLAFGFGVFKANTIINHNQWHGTSHYGWSVGRKGFLTQQMFGYALAVASFIKEEKEPEWSKYLCRDVKGYFNKGIKFIQANQDEYLKYKKELIFDTDSPLSPPDYIYTRKNYFKKGPLASVSEMKNDFKHGLTRYYHRNGVLWSEWEYKNNVPWNVAFNHNNKSKPQETGTLKNGTGSLYSYLDNDELSFIAYYENGKLLKIDRFKDEYAEPTTNN